MNVWDQPIYSGAMAGRLVGLGAWCVRRWLQGYDYKYSAGDIGEIRTGHKGPVIQRSKSDDSPYASFIELIDLLFVKKFLDHGLSLQKIRKALKEAEELLGGYHYAQRDFFTDGKNIYLQVKNTADSLLELLSGGQWVIAPIIKQLAHQIDFDEPSGLAQRWYPLGTEGMIVLDPRISFGKPTIVGRGITSANVYDFYIGEEKRIKRVCEWMDLNSKEVEAAVIFEQNLIAA